MLVPGSEWGDDSPWLARVASVLAKEAPSVTVVIHGGDTGWKAVSQSVEASRPVLDIADSRRAADSLAGTLRGGAADGWAKDFLAAPGLVRVVNVCAGSDAIAEAIEQMLSARE